MRGWFFLLLATLSATEYAPWLTRQLEIVPTATFGCQDTDPYAAFSVLMPKDKWSAELEFETAKTHYRSWTPSDLKGTLRLEFSSDILDDPYALIAGFSLAKVFRPARKDPTFIFPGGLEGELSLSIGREKTCANTWDSRWWLMGAFGRADQGSPWLRLNGSYEWNCEPHFLALVAYSRCGLGSHHWKPFHGYGSVAYRLLDLGARYTYRTDSDLLVSLEYTYRIWAHNTFQDVNRIALSLSYPFGL